MPLIFDLMGVYPVPGSWSIGSWFSGSWFSGSWFRESWSRGPNSYQSTVQKYTNTFNQHT